MKIRLKRQRKLLRGCRCFGFLLGNNVVPPVQDPPLPPHAYCIDVYVYRKKRERSRGLIEKRFPIYFFIHLHVFVLVRMEREATVCSLITRVQNVSRDGLKPLISFIKIYYDDDDGVMAHSFGPPGPYVL
jgi:hypothetical protein